MFQGKIFQHKKSDGQDGLFHTHQTITESVVRPGPIIDGQREAKKNILAKNKMFRARTRSFAFEVFPRCERSRHSVENENYLHLQPTSERGEESMSLFVCVRVKLPHTVERNETHTHTQTHTQK